MAMTNEHTAQSEPKHSHDFIKQKREREIYFKVWNLTSFLECLAWTQTISRDL